MCDHFSTINDCDSSSVVCKECGIVLQSIYYSPNTNLFYSEEKQNNESTIDDYASSSSNTPCIIHTKLLYEFQDFCDRGHISKMFVYPAYQKFQYLLKNFRHQCLSNRDASIGVCLYETLKENDVPRSLKEISQITAQSSQNLARLLNHFFPNTSTIRPEKMIFRFGRNLDFLPSHLLKIEKMIEVIIPSLNDSTHPLTIVAAFLCLYAKNFTLGKTQTDICEQVGVTPISVRRFLKKNSFLANKEFWKHGFEENNIRKPWWQRIQKKSMFECSESKDRDRKQRKTTKDRDRKQRKTSKAQKRRSIKKGKN